MYIDHSSALWYALHVVLLAIIPLLAVIVTWVLLKQLARNIVGCCG
jgi:hypothetical protein